MSSSILYYTISLKWITVHVSRVLISKLRCTLTIILANGADPGDIYTYISYFKLTSVNILCLSLVTIFIWPGKSMLQI